MDFKKIFDVEREEAFSYSPVISELTPKQERRIRIVKRVKYILKIINYLAMIAVGLTFVYPFVWMFLMSVRGSRSLLARPLGERMALGKLHPGLEQGPLQYLSRQFRDLRGIGIGTAIFLHSPRGLRICQNEVQRQ